jgi:hypothetical protein
MRGAGVMIIIFIDRILIRHTFVCFVCVRSVGKFLKANKSLPPKQREERERERERKGAKGPTEHEQIMQSRAIYISMSKGAMPQHRWRYDNITQIQLQCYQLTAPPASSRLSCPQPQWKLGVTPHN